MSEICHSPGSQGFQSLIGRLKTGGVQSVTLFYLAFQSLIGRLKTITFLEPSETGGEFQSLIGRLKTVLASRL